MMNPALGVIVDALRPTNNKTPAQGTRWAIRVDLRAAACEVDGTQPAHCNVYRPRSGPKQQ